MLAQYLALAKRQGWKRAMRSEFRSIFTPNHSVWEALQIMMEKVEPFKSELEPLRDGMYEDELAKAMALSTWRPRGAVTSLFDSFQNGGRSVNHYWVPCNRPKLP